MYVSYLRSYLRSNRESPWKNPSLARRADVRAPKRVRSRHTHQSPNETPDAISNGYRNSPKKRKAPATAAAAAKRPAVANPYTKNNTDGRLAALAEEQEQEGTRDSTTASNNAELGQARSITNVDNSAEHIAAIFCKFRGLPPKPTKIEIAGRQAEQQMRDLCTFLSTRHIPINFDDELNPPPNSRNNRCVKDTTLGKYAGTNDSAKWIRIMKIGKACTKSKTQFGGLVCCMR